MQVVLACYAWLAHELTPMCMFAGEFTPGKYGEWRYDKRGYSGKPMPRNLSELWERLHVHWVLRLQGSLGGCQL